MVVEPVVSVTLSVTSVVLPESDATPPNRGVSHQLDVPKFLPVVPTQTPIKTSPLGTCPVQKRARIPERLPLGLLLNKRTK